MSSSSSSGSDSETNLRSTDKKAKGKDRQKQKHATVRTVHGKNEGVNPDWAYKVPSGATLLSAGEETEEFDWDSLTNNEDIELWIMRVPEGLKAKHLQEFMLDAPSGSTSISAKMGSLERKSATYDAWSLGDDSHSSVGAEEMKSFTFLAPRRTKAGKLFVGPEVPTRHVVFSARPDAQPLLDEDLSWARQQNPPRPSYPQDMLKHRFVPFGSVANAAVPTPEDTMDVDHQPSSPRTRRTKATKDDDVKVKKRKTEVEGNPRKTKKSHGITA